MYVCCMHVQSLLVTYESLLAAMWTDQTLDLYDYEAL